MNSSSVSSQPPQKPHPPLREAMPAWMDDELMARRRLGLYRRRRRATWARGARIRIEGREYINFASNDYLNLASDPQLAQVAAWAAKRYGCGAGSSPLVSGYLPPHRALERALAEWEGTEAALTFSSGYTANVGVLTALAGRGDVIFSDKLNHASLIDGCRLSRADVHVYRHRDIGHLRELLEKYSPAARRPLIVSDTVFSMDGDLAPLAELVELSERFDALLVIDEAHATGVLGEKGTGLTELLPVTRKPDPDRVVKIGTLSKALGTQGGFVCGTRRLIDYLVNTARPYIFSTALTPPMAGAAWRAVTIASAARDSRQHLAGLSAALRAGVTNMVAQHAQSSPIIPIIVGEATAAVRLSKQLQRRGLLVPAIRPPTVPEGTARLRISLTAGHTQDDVLRLLTALDECIHSAR
jgi:8-amino-7-oxononanoate synthase